jgi:hypothetical protein
MEEQHAEYLRAQQTTPGYKLLRSYTGFSARWVVLTTYLRSPSPSSYKRMIEGFKSEEGLKTAINMLNDVILGAPKTDKEIVVYRGQGSFKTPVVDGVITLNGFVGASLLPKIAAGFATSPKCCMYELRLPAGTPVLFIKSISGVPEEEEILLPFNSQFRMTGTTTIDVDGEPFQVDTGVYVGSMPFEKMDFSKRSMIDETTAAVIQSAVGAQKRMFARSRELARCGTPSENKEQCASMDAEFEERLEMIAKEYGVTVNDVKKVMQTAGKRRKTLRKRKQRHTVRRKNFQRKRVYQ